MALLDGLYCLLAAGTDVQGPNKFVRMARQADLVDGLERLAGFNDMVADKATRILNQFFAQVSQLKRAGGEREREKERKRERSQNSMTNACSFF